MGLTRQVLDIDAVFTPGAGGASTTISKDDIKEVTIIQEELNGDSCTIVVNNLNGQHKTSFYEGYTVEINVQFSGEGSATLFWKGRVLKKYPNRPRYKEQTIVVEAMDEGTYQLSGIKTTAAHSYASTDAGYIIEDLVDTYTTMDTTNIDTSTGRTISITIPIGRNLLDTIRELTIATGYTFYVDEDLDAYLVDRGGTGTYTLGATDGRNFSVDRDILSVKNDILVKGAYISDATSTKQEGPPDGYWSVDNSTNRRKIKFAPSGTIIQVAVTAYNSTSPASTHNLMLRIQPDDGTGSNPVAISDYNADIGAVFIPNALIPTAAAGSVGGKLSANLVDGEDDYWLIVESDSATGNLLTVGYKTVATVDTLIYEAYTREELSGTASDATSQSDYGVRSYTYIDRTLQTQDEVDEKAAALLAEYKDIANVVECDLDNDIFGGDHARLGDKVTVTLADEDISAVAMGVVGLTWQFKSDNGTYLNQSIVVGDTSPPLTEGDYNAMLSRRIDALGNQQITMEAGQPIVAAHGPTKHYDRTSNIWLGAGAMQGWGSTEPEMTIGYKAALAYDSASDEMAAGTVLVPADYASGALTIYLVWYCTATSGDVYWNTKASIMGNAGDAGPTSSSDIIIVTVPRTSGETEKTQVTTVTPPNGGGDVLTIAVKRDANDASDTAAANAYLLGVLIQYTADQ